MRHWIRAVALGIAIISGAHAAAQPVVEASLASRLAPLLADPRWRDLRVGFIVADAATGRALFEHGADVSLNPASNAKLLTAAVALSVLGPSRRFVTALHGVARGGVIVGSLVLRGQGDPSLREADLFELAQRLAAIGIRRVEGDVVVDDGEFGAEHLPPAFDQRPRETAPFRAAVSAVSVDENAFTIDLRPGAAPDDPAAVHVSPNGYAELENSLTTGGDASSVSISTSLTAGGRERVRVAGRLPVGAPTATYRRRIENPSLASGYVLRAMLLAAGIHVRGGVRVAPGSAAGLQRVASRESAPVSALLYEVGKDSNNFYAEMMVLAIAASSVTGASGPTTFAAGTERIARWAHDAGVEGDGLVVRNGSGLYDANRITARQVTQVLRAAWRDPAIRHEYIAQLAVGGDDGTLRNRLDIRGAPRVVRAKTGTLDDVIALSGYVLTADPSRALVFAFIANGVRGRAAEVRQLADQVATRVAEASTVRP